MKFIKFCGKLINYASFTYIEIPSMRLTNVLICAVFADTSFNVKCSDERRWVWNTECTNAKCYNTLGKLFFRKYKLHICNFPYFSLTTFLWMLGNFIVINIVQFAKLASGEFNLPYRNDKKTTEHLGYSILGIWNVNHKGPLRSESGFLLQSPRSHF